MPRMMEAAAEKRLQWAICCAAGRSPTQISPEGLGGLSRRSTTGAKTEALAKTEAFWRRRVGVVTAIFYGLAVISNCELENKAGLANAGSAFVMACAA